MNTANGKGKGRGVHQKIIGTKPNHLKKLGSPTVKTPGGQT